MITEFREQSKNREAIRQKLCLGSTPCSVFAKQSRFLASEALDNLGVWIGWIRLIMDGLPNGLTEATLEGFHNIQYIKSEINKFLANL
jgi:hypothetical protein